MRRNTLYAVGLCLVMFVNSCVHEDVSECFYGLRLSFVSTLYDAQNEPDYKPEVGNVKVFVFDTNDVLYATASGTANCLASDYKLDIALPAGTYKVMTWGSGGVDLLRSYVDGAVDTQGNSTGAVPVKIGQTRLADFLLSLRSTTDNELADRLLPTMADFDDLYYGTVGKRAVNTSVYSMEEVVVPQYSIVEKQVDLMRNTNLLRVSITGTQNTLFGKENIEVYAQGHNSGYSFENNRNGKLGAMKYAAVELPITDNSWGYEIRTKRIEHNTYADKPLMLYIFNRQSKQQIYKLNVIEVLLAARDGNGNYLYKSQEAVDRKYVHSIELMIEGEPGGGGGEDIEGERLEIRIFVNGWEVNTIYPGWKL